MFLFATKQILLYIAGFWLSPGFLEHLGRSGRLIRTISTYPGTYKCPRSRGIAKNPPGGIFLTEYGKGPVKPFERATTEMKAICVGLFQQHVFEDILVWVRILDKKHIKFDQGLDCLIFYQGNRGQNQ